MRKHALAYILTILVFGTGIFLTIQQGRKLEKPEVAVGVLTAPGQPRPAESGSWFSALSHNLREPMSLLLVQLVVIVVLARVCGAVAVKMGQPAVIGEMLAGIVLGPSLLGVAFPDLFAFIFPENSLGALRMLAQVGIILFMYVVGMEIEVTHLRKADTAVMVSHVSIVFPYFLGVLASYFIYEQYASNQITFLAFALFMGTSMSITAFPVLARILEDRGLTKTFLGSTAITCAAVDDLTAWTVLAFVVAIVKSGGLATSAMTIVLSILFILGMVFIVRRVLNRIIAARPRMVSNPSRGMVVGILVLVFTSALITEVIGIHALFGAFIAGIIMPMYPQFRAHLKDRLENFSSAFLLPLFFAFTGLRTHIDLLNDWQSWSLCLGLIAVATLGKLGGSMLAARFTGMDWHDSFKLGALMNTRGLVGLIVLDIGLELGILSPRVFTMMVVVALVTTFMTSPLLSLADAVRRRGLPVGAGAQS